MHRKSGAIIPRLTWIEQQHNAPTLDVALSRLTPISRNAVRALIGKVAPFSRPLTTFFWKGAPFEQRGLI